MQSWSVEELLEAAAKFETEINIEYIAPCYTAALEKAPADPRVLDAFAEYLIGVGQN